MILMQIFFIEDNWYPIYFVPKKFSQFATFNDAELETPLAWLLSLYNRSIQLCLRFFCSNNTHPTPNFSRSLEICLEKFREV